MRARSASVVRWRQAIPPAKASGDPRSGQTRGTISLNSTKTPIATVSAPLAWSELPDAEPDDFTVRTMPERFTRVGDLFAPIDDVAHRLDTLLEWAERDEANDDVADGDDTPPPEPPTP